MSERAPTAQEEQWWRIFSQCVKDMPSTMEVHVSAHGDLSAAPQGAYMASMDAGGDGGDSEKLTLPFIHRPNFCDVAGAL